MGHTTKGVLFSIAAALVTAAVFGLTGHNIFGGDPVFAYAGSLLGALFSAAAFPWLAESLARQITNRRRNPDRDAFIVGTRLGGLAALAVVALVGFSYS